MDPIEQFKSITEVLEMFYLWPKGDNPDNVNYSLYLKFLCIYTFISFPEVLTLLHGYHNRFIANFSLMIDLIIILVFTHLTTIFIIFAYNLKEIVRLSNHYSPWITSLHEIRVDCKRINRVVRYLLVIVLILLGLFVQWDTENCEKRKTRHNSLESCGLYFPIYLPFEYDFFPLKQYILIHQGLTLFIAFASVIQIAFIFLYIIISSVGILTTLIHLVEDFDNCLKHNQDVTDRLRAMVKIHQHLIRFIRVADKLSRFSQMANFMFGSLIMACSIFHLIKTGNLLTAIHGSLWAICLSLMQFAGQLPISKGLEFERAMHNTRWYKLKKLEDRRCFLLLLHMAQRPVALHAGPFAELSLETLLGLMKGIYSGTTMLINATRTH